MNPESFVASRIHASGLKHEGKSLIMPIMLTPRQSKAARALLNWHQRDLAAASGIPLSTVKDFEASRHQLGARGLSAIARAYQKAGLLLFFDDGVAGVGVRMKEPSAE